MNGTTPWHLQGNRAPVNAEHDAVDLKVAGRIPPALDGHYIRNGPNPRAAGSHWFTGDGMLHGVRIRDGRAQWYRNRWVRTDSFQTPFPLYNPADGSRNLHASAANTHIVRHAGRLLALVESSLPYEVTTDLETLGCYDFDGALTNSMTAHPKVCPATGELHFFGYGSLRAPYVRYHRADAAGRLVVDQPVEVSGLTMMHDFALTAKHVLFLDLPLCFDLESARAGDNLPYRWRPDYGARIGVMLRSQPAAPIRWFEIEPCYIFHVANAYDEGTQIVLQAVRYPHMWKHGTFDAPGNLWQWHLDLKTGTASESQLDDADCEFPRIDDSNTGSPTNAIVTASATSINRYDTATGTTLRWDLKNDEPGEATFVTDPETRDRYLMSYTYRTVANHSELLILNADQPGSEPIATIELPFRVPAGFHGNWFPAHPPTPEIQANQEPF